MAELQPHEVHELLGAYALDAVDPDERAQIERFLVTSPADRREVERFRETASMLAFAGADAPPGLWDRITHATHDDLPRLVLNPRKPRGWKLGGLIAAAVAAVTIAVLGIQVADQSARLDDLQHALEHDGVREAAEVARTDPSARFATLRFDDETRGAEVVYLPDGTGYLEVRDLLSLPVGRTYQLWALFGDANRPTVISVGILGPSPDVSAFRVSGPVIGFVVTEEDVPGVVSSSNPALLSGSLRRS